MYMKKKYFLIVIACLAMLAVSCKDKKAEQANNRLKVQNDSLVAALNNRSGQIDDLMGTVNEVQEGFKQISAAEGRLDMHQAPAEKSQSARQSLAQDIAFIKTTMHQNKERIAGLKEKLKDSKNVSAAQLEHMQKLIDGLQAQFEQQQKESAKKIKDLQDELASKNVHIAELDKSVTELQGNVSSLSSDNASKARVMAQQDKDLNKAWYVFGTKKELKEQKILVDGQVLKNNTYNKNYFTQVDIRTQKEIKLYSKKVSVLTTHPAGSYELVRDENKEYSLRITNPSEFWSVSKFLVIQVK